MSEPGKKLILLRHAKSDWDAPYNADFDRPLNERGRQSAPLIADHAKKHGHRPDLVLCSPATRTRQTLKLFCEGLGATPQIEFVQSLYGADTGQINTLIRQTPDDIETLMIVGHNPGLGAMAYTLSPENSDLFGKFPTASFAVFSYENHAWSTFDYGPCTSLDFVKPRDLS